MRQAKLKFGSSIADHDFAVLNGRGHHGYLLSRVHQEELHAGFMGGDEIAGQRLVRSMMRLVAKQAVFYSNRNNKLIAAGDLFQDGMLTVAANLYKWQPEVAALSTFLFLKIKSAMRRRIYRDRNLDFTGIWNNEDGKMCRIVGPTVDAHKVIGHEDGQEIKLCDTIPGDEAESQRTRERERLEEIIREVFPDSLFARKSKSGGYQNWKHGISPLRIMTYQFLGHEGLRSNDEVCERFSIPLGYLQNQQTILRKALGIRKVFVTESHRKATVKLIRERRDISDREIGKEIGLNLDQVWRIRKEGNLPSRKARMAAK